MFSRKCALAGFLIFSLGGLAAQANFTNLRYGLVTGPMLELGFGKFGLGVSSSSASYSSLDYTAKMNLTGGRLSFYFKQFDMSSFYLAADAGQLKADFNQINVSGTQFTGTSNSTYTGAWIGYRWFWGWFNMNIGLGSLSYVVKDLTLTSSTGETSAVPGFSVSAPALDIGLGISFF